MHNKKLIISAVSALFALAIIAFGIYVTFVAYKDQDKDKDLPEWVVKNREMFKWLGPLILVVGLVAFVFALVVIVRQTKKDETAKLQFGFTFY